MTALIADPARTALPIADMQDDILHPGGACTRAAIACLLVGGIVTRARAPGGQTR